MIVLVGVAVTCEPCIIGGIPAKLIKMRFTPEQIKEHEKILKTKE